MSMSKALVIGNVGSEPDMRYTPGGSAVTTFSVATNRSYTTSSGERREETQWFRVSAWGRLAETCNNFVTKGMKVYVEGRLSSRTWTTQEGQERHELEISASDVTFLSRKGETSEGVAESPYSGGASGYSGGPSPDAGGGGPASTPEGAEGTEILPW